MLVCMKCGAENPMGRVFCGACGGRLDLSAMRAGMVQKPRQPNWFSRYWGLVVGLVVLLFLGVASLCLFAKTAPVGVVGSRVDLTAFTRPLRQLQTVRPGRAIAATFSEKSINAFLALKARRLGAESISVSIGEGYFSVRFVQALEPIGVGSFEYIPRFSYDYTFVPIGGVVRTRRVAMGRLRLLGPFKRMAVRKLVGRASSLEEWRTFAQVTEIRAEDGNIWVKASK